MSAEIVSPEGGILAIRANQTGWTEEQKAVMRQLFPDPNRQPTPADTAVFLHICQRTGLDPFARQIYMIERAGRWVIQTGIDGFRVVAQRSGEYEGQEGPFWAGADGGWHEHSWTLPEVPRVARVGIWRTGFRSPAWGVALWSEYGEKAAGPTWREKPAHMLAKCAEALALRKAFPQDLSGIYEPAEIPDEPAEPRPALTIDPPPEAPPVVGEVESDDDLAARRGRIAAEIRDEALAPDVDGETLKRLLLRATKERVTSVVVPNLLGNDVQLAVLLGERITELTRRPK